MKNEFKGTKGKYVGAVKEEHNALIFIECGTISIARIHYGNFKHTANKEEAEANAHLIAEAFNVVNSTGYSPNQLAEQNKELLEACKRAERHHQGLHSEIGSILRNAIANAEK